VATPPDPRSESAGHQKRSSSAIARDAMLGCVGVAGKDLAWNNIKIGVGTVLSGTLPLGRAAALPPPPLPPPWVGPGSVASMLGPACGAGRHPSSPVLLSESSVGQRGISALTTQLLVPVSGANKTIAVLFNIMKAAN
jgi:hypothetical protein